MTKGKNTAAIGKREERQIVKDLQALGYDCRRQPGSGNRAVDLQHDIVWKDSPAGKLHIEDKYRDKSQWQRLEAYRAGADILTVRCHAGRTGQNGERMAFLPWKLLLELVGESRQVMDMAEARSIGGHARAAALSPERRSEIASNAAKARWQPTTLHKAQEKAKRKAVQTTYTPPPKRKPLRKRSWPKRKVGA